MNHVLRHLRRAALLCTGEGPPDEQLLESFLVRRDEVSFEALLRRHGPMVLGVCQRVLRNVHDAEDAFQATFLVLARKAGSIRSRRVVAGWLYGVAYRTAMKARVMNAKRRRKERQAGEIPRPQSSADDELLAQLDHELNRLPDKYRVPVVLCELEGRSRKEVARILGVPEGTLSWRLAQAKKLLARKLSRFELAIPLGALAVGLSPTLRASTLKAALTAGTVPAQVLVLTEGVMKAMLLSKLKITVCVTALALVAGVGASGLAYRVAAQEPTRSESVAASLPSAVSPSATDELEALRLEIEALRKLLQATRERVKTLEGEVGALKGNRGGPAAMMGLDTLQSHSQGMGSGRAGSRGSGAGQGGSSADTRHPPGGAANRPSSSQPGTSNQPSSPGADGKNANKDKPKRGKTSGNPFGQGGNRSGSDSTWTKRTTDPVSDAEAALEKLRANPGDKQAVEALERALKRLKEREKPQQSNPPSQR